METGLLLIRVVLGGIMAAHGAQKLFGWFGGHGLAGTAGWLETMGMRPGPMQARGYERARRVRGRRAPRSRPAHSPRCGRRRRRDVRGDRDRPLEERVLQLERRLRVQPVDHRRRARPRVHRSRHDLDRRPRRMDPGRTRVGPRRSRPLRGRRGIRPRDAQASGPSRHKKRH